MSFCDNFKADLKYEQCYFSGFKSPLNNSKYLLYSSINVIINAHA